MQHFNGIIKDGIAGVFGTPLFLSNQTKKEFEMTASSIPVFCSIGNCLNTIKAHGWCEKHYMRWYEHGDPTFTKQWMGEGSTPIERFWARVQLTADLERCWNWIGVKNEHGYGTVVFAKKRYKAHRLAWFFVMGSHPSSHLLHFCDNPSCVNPRHLREGTQKENVQDMVDKGRHHTHGRTHCKNGHDITVPLSTRQCVSKGKAENVCVLCARERANRYVRRKSLEKRQQRCSIS